MSDWIEVDGKVLLSERMKALTVHQPWASLIAHGVKRIETRSWQTRYRGPLAIHAGLAFSRKAKEFAVSPDVLHAHAFKLRWDEYYPRGAVIAIATLDGCIPCEALADSGRRFDPLTPLERSLGDFSAERWGWILRDVKPLDKPIPAKGAQGLWNWDGGTNA